jgi:uncharacterized protein YbcI
MQTIEPGPTPPTFQTMARQIAEVASELQFQRSGHRPSSVAASLSGDTLVITLGGAFTPAETALARDVTGAARIQEYHRQLFSSSAESLRTEIRRITGVDVRESAAEVEPIAGTVLHPFSSGTMIQVFLLSGNFPPEVWHSNETAKPNHEHS